MSDDLRRRLDGISDNGVDLQPGSEEPYCSVNDRRQLELNTLWVVRELQPVETGECVGDVVGAL